MTEHYLITQNSAARSREQTAENLLVEHLIYFALNRVRVVPFAVNNILCYLAVGLLGFV